MLNALFIYWNISPEAFSIGPFTIRYYGIMFICAFILGTYIFYYILKNEKADIILLPVCLNAVFLSTIIGARLGECLFYYPEYFLLNPLEIFIPFRNGEYTGIAGMSSHGAAIAIPIGLYFVSRNKNFSYLWLIDRVVICVALAACLIRIGNLLNSEILGIETTLPWGFVFEQRNETFARHPVQLYESITYFLIFLLLFYLYRKKKLVNGILLGLFITLVFTSRFFLEYLKAPQNTFDVNAPFKMGQYLSFPLIIIGTLLLMYVIMTSDLKKNSTN